MLGFRERAAIALAGSIYLHLLMVAFSDAGNSTAREQTNGFNPIFAYIDSHKDAGAFTEVKDNRTDHIAATDLYKETVHRKREDDKTKGPTSPSKTGFLQGVQYLKSTEVDKAAMPVALAPLIYPEAAYASKLAGRVKVRLFINKSGSVDTAMVLSNSTKYKAFEDAAILALQNSIFEPAILNGSPVNSERVVEVEFNPEEEA